MNALVVATPSVELIMQIVGDVSQPCDYSDRSWCRKGAAKFIASLVPCACGAAGHRLICEGCKQILLEQEDTCFSCDCGEFTAPARLAFSRLERLFT